MELDAINGAEIDIPLLGFQAENGRAVFASLHNIAIPPGKSQLARFDPGCVFNGARLVEAVDDIRFEKRTGTVRDYSDTPGRLKGEIPDNFRPIRPGRKAAHELRLVCTTGAAHQRHACVFAQGGFRDRDILAVTPAKSRRHIEKRVSFY